MSSTNLDQAAVNVFPNRGRCRYNDVQVLLLRWEQDDMGVAWELDDLAITLKNVYGFNTETWLIPTTQPHLSLMGKAFKMVQNFGNKHNLLIVYYAGHGGMSPSRQPLWTWSVFSSYRPSSVVLTILIVLLILNPHPSMVCDPNHIRAG